MARRRWVQDRHTGEMVEIGEETGFAEPTGPIIMGDIEPFISTVDKTYIGSRSTLREHNKKNDVTHISDFKETWAKAQKQREAYRKGEFVSKSMRESLEREIYRGS